MRSRKKRILGWTLGVIFFVFLEILAGIVGYHLNLEDHVLGVCLALLLGAVIFPWFEVIFFLGLFTF